MQNKLDLTSKDKIVEGFMITCLFSGVEKLSVPGICITGCEIRGEKFTALISGPERAFL